VSIANATDNPFVSSDSSGGVSWLLETTLLSIPVLWWLLLLPVLSLLVCVVVRIRRFVRRSKTRVHLSRSSSPDAARQGSPRAARLSAQARRADASDDDEPATMQSPWKESQAPLAWRNSMVRPMSHVDSVSGFRARISELGQPQIVLAEGLDLRELSPMPTPLLEVSLLREQMMLAPDETVRPPALLPIPMRTQLARAPMPRASVRRSLPRGPLPPLRPPGSRFVHNTVRVGRLNEPQLVCDSPPATTTDMLPAHEQLLTGDAMRPKPAARFDLLSGASGADIADEQWRITSRSDRGSVAIYEPTSEAT
jgi:hypothetical protein